MTLLPRSGHCLRRVPSGRPICVDEEALKAERAEHAKVVEWLEALRPQREAEDAYVRWLMDGKDPAAFVWPKLPSTCEPGLRLFKHP